MSVLGLAQPAGADTFSIIHDVNSPIAGADEVRFPNLVFGGDGALYGISYFEYADDKSGYPVHAELFRLAPPASGKSTWTYSTLLDFDNPYGIDNGPIGLVSDKSGSLYTQYVGSYGAKHPSDTGFIVKLTPPANGIGPWSKVLVHQFVGSEANFIPNFITFNGGGVLSGTDGYTIYRLSPPSGGRTGWGYSVVYKQPGGASSLVLTGFVQAADGSLFGDGQDPRTYLGALWRLKPPAAGQSTPSFDVLATFPAGSPIGYHPGVPTVDRSLRVYDWNMGSQNGSDVGTVFRLSPPALGQSKWGKSLLYAFQGTTDSGSPNAQLEAPDGRLYGVASCKNIYDYSTSCRGVITSSGQSTVDTLFSVTPRDYGGHQVPWHHETLHTFKQDTTGQYPDGISPEVLVKGRLPDGRFAIFGLTTAGGAHGFGTIFEYVP